MNVRTRGAKSHVFRFRMQMSISDVSECVVYVDFNGSVTKMTNVTAAEVAQLMVYNLGDDMPRAGTLTTKRSLGVSNP
ncbi:hypothetical protein F2Q70_00021771 [Brassica cretica]|nr:hypothetical protein F2Q70_00021771 [Brassica cretica]KAF2557149.1 hypothetical protein F2Q68_00015471 [Brassica cretica]KAF3585475.1 hypothetical protein F2Q69_00029279 [Brassica cretica]